MEANNIKRLCLWSGPRNISTALMYSFAQRSDTRVYDEPLYAHYLSKTDADSYHPGSQDVMDSIENDGNKVVEMMMGHHDKPVVFFKNMTHHLLDLDRTFMKDVVNIILTRDPVEMLPSFDEVIESPDMRDVGYQLHTELLNYFQENAITPIVIDSKKVLLNPKETLSKLCDLAKIPFDQSMLNWEAGARPEDGVWAKYWYGNVHKSTGFAKYKPKEGLFPERLKTLLEKCQPHYRRLSEMAI